jgi:hypothetical protein
MGTWSGPGGVLDAVSDRSFPLNNDAARSNIDGLLVICVEIRMRSISERLIGKLIVVANCLLDA